MFEDLILHYQTIPLDELERDLIKAGMTFSVNEEYYAKWAANAQDCKSYENTQPDFAKFWLDDFETISNVEFKNALNQNLIKKSEYSSANSNLYKNKLQYETKYSMKKGYFETSDAA